MCLQLNKARCCSNFSNMDSKLDPQKFARKDLYKLFALSPSSTNDEAQKPFLAFLYRLVLFTLDELSSKHSFYFLKSS